MRVNTASSVVISAASKNLFGEQFCSERAQQTNTSNNAIFWPDVGMHPTIFSESVEENQS